VFGSRCAVSGDGEIREAADPEDLHRLRDPYADVDLIAADLDGAVVAGAGEVGERGLASLFGVQGELAARSVGGEVDRLCAGPSRLLCFIDGFHMRGEGQTAVDDEAGEQDQHSGKDDDESRHRSVLTVEAFRAASGDAEGHGPSPRYRSRGATARAVSVLADGIRRPVTSSSSTVQATVTPTDPPGWNSVVSTVTSRCAQTHVVVGERSRRGRPRRACRGNGIAGDRGGTRSLVRGAVEIDAGSCESAERHDEQQEKNE